MHPARIVYDLPNGTYHADDGTLSASRLKRCFASPAAARRPPKKPKDRKPLDLGSALHALVLEGVAPPVSPWENYKKKEAQDWRDAQIAAGVPVLSADDAAQVEAMGEAVASWHAAWVTAGNAPILPFGLASWGVAEASVYWTEQGIAMRCRPDFLIFPTDATGAPIRPSSGVAWGTPWASPPVVVSIKTAGGRVGARDWARRQYTCVTDTDAKYDVGEAHYCAGIAALYGIAPEDVACLWVVVDTETLEVICADFGDAGRRRAIALRQQCIRHFLDRDVVTHDVTVRQYTIPPWADKQDHFTTGDDE
jgi:hypothetical protein